MKKAAKKKVSRAPKVGSKNSLLLVAVLILAVLAFVVWAVIAKSPGKTPKAAGYLYNLSTPIVSGINATFAISPQVDGKNIALIVKSTSSSFWPAYQSPVISGSSVKFSDARIDSYYAVLVSLNSLGQPDGSVSNSVNFNISGYTLSEPIISGKKATFTISPEITDSNIYLQLAQYSGPGLYKTPLIKGGTVSWVAESSGAYHAYLVSDGPKVSNASNTVIVLIPFNRCDFNKDGKVDQLDVNIAAGGFGKVGTSLNQPYDVNRDGWVNSLDLLIISKNNPTYCN